MEDKEKLELEVRRVLSSEAEGYRIFLQSQFRYLMWGVGILFLAGAAIFTYLFGDSIEKSKEQLISTIDARIIDYRIVESFKKRLQESIDIAVDQAVDHEETRKNIDDQVEESAKTAYRRVASNIEDTIIEIVDKQILKSRNLDASQIIEKVSMPSGAVLAFNRETCPPDWKEYALAYGRFIRGIDKGDSGIDPDGERELGSTQSEQFKAHSHTRPRGVYDAGGGPDSAWVAHSRHFGYGHSNPPSTGKVGGSETRPDNVALLYCEKT